jgi:ribosomal protein S27E
MEFVVYVYANKSPAVELKTFRCPNCGRIVFRHNSERIQLSNAYGASFTELPPNSNFIEHKCHSCRALYQILFQ